MMIFFYVGFGDKSPHGRTCSSSLADPLFSTSISRHRFRKSLNIVDSFSGFCSSGVPLVAMRYSAYDTHKSRFLSIKILHFAATQWWFLG